MITAQQTKSYFDRYPNMALRPIVLGRTGLLVSRVGFGGYRINSQSQEHRVAFLKAMQSGCNLIDTSTNYTDGRSQELIGDCFRSERISREGLVIVSKVGYVQGRRLDEFKRFARLNGQETFPEILKYDEDCWHCLHPDFIQSEIDQSLSRMKVDFIDVMLLHNPEYFLMKHPQEVDRYYERIQKALSYLEMEVERGRIHWIGVSSNTFIESEDHPHFSSLERIFSSHQALHKNHHFAVVQMPFNLYEQGLIRSKRKSGYSTLEFARKHKLGVLVNRPLNAIKSGQLVRLTDIGHGVEIQKMDDLILDLKGFEENASEKAFLSSADLHKVMKREFLQKVSEQILDYFSFRDYIQFQFLPYWEHICKETIQKQPRSQLWVDAYQKSFNSLGRSILLQKQNNSADNIERIKNRLDDRAVSLKISQSLSQKLVRIYSGQTGIHVILVGMRKEEYVEDVLTCDAAIDLASSDAVLDLFKE